MVTCHLISEVQLNTSLLPASLPLLLMEGKQTVPACGHSNIQEHYFIWQILLVTSHQVSHTNQATQRIATTLNEPRAASMKILDEIRAEYVCYSNSYLNSEESFLIRFFQTGQQFTNTLSDFGFPRWDLNENCDVLTFYGSIFKGQDWLLKMEPTGWPKTSVSNYYSTLRKVPESGAVHLKTFGATGYILVR